jgi:hypothetical protein
MMRREPDLTGITITAKPTADLTDADVATMLALFDIAYRDANHAYLKKSFGTLRFAAIAMHGDTPAGFALGEARIVDLPRLPATAVRLAGICCIAPAFRRRGLFSALTGGAWRLGEMPQSDRFLICGRMAHPAIFRTMTFNPTHVPKPDIEPTAWQQEVGQALADIYGVARFDPKTFVCHGSGVPIGYPRLEMELQPEEWRVFDHVNRDAGDSLLGMAWVPDGPDGW